jgi:hypothetical protein
MAGRRQIEDIDLSPTGSGKAGKIHLLRAYRAFSPEDPAVRGSQKRCGAERVGSAGAGQGSTGVGGRDADLPCFGRPGLAWRKMRWQCRADTCQAGSWTIV